MNEHIVINKDRSVVVPISEKKIGIQYDHNVNKITFDCPRYADDNEAIDMSRMHVFLNYMLPDKTTGCTILENVVVDETDPAIIHFDWVVTRNHTRVKGVMSTLICIKQTDTEGTELYHWNTDLFQQFIVGDGMECGKIVVDENPDVITQLLVRMDAVDARTSTEAIQGYVDTSVNTYLNQNPITPTDEQATTGINTYMNNHAQGCVNNYLTEHPVSPTEEQMKQGVAANSEMFQSSVDDYLGRNPLQLDNGLTETTKAAPANKVGEIQSYVTDLKGDLVNYVKNVGINIARESNLIKNNAAASTFVENEDGTITVTPTQSWGRYDYTYPIKDENRIKTFYFAFKTETERKNPDIAVYLYDSAKSNLKTIDIIANTNFITDDGYKVKECLLQYKDTQINAVRMDIGILTGTDISYTIEKNPFVLIDITDTYNTDNADDIFEVCKEYYGYEYFENKQTAMTAQTSLTAQEALTAQAAMTAQEALTAQAAMTAQTAEDMPFTLKNRGSSDFIVDGDKVTFTPKMYYYGFIIKSDIGFSKDGNLLVVFESDFYVDSVTFALGQEKSNGSGYEVTKGCSIYGIDNKYYYYCIIPVVTTGKHELDVYFVKAYVGYENESHTITVKKFAYAISDTVTEAMLDIICNDKTLLDFMNDVYETNKKVYELDTSIHSSWKGKNALVIGDSITAANKWQLELTNLLGMNVTTHAKGGIGTAKMVDGDNGLGGDYDNETSASGTLKPLSVDDVTGIDLIVVAPAYNDRGKGDGVVGDCYNPDGTGQNTISGLIQYTINRIFEELTNANNLTCKVLYVTPYCHGKYPYIDANGYDEYPSGTGRTTETLGKAIIDVCNHNNIPVCDLWHNACINKFTWNIHGASSNPVNETYSPYQLDESGNPVSETRIRYVNGQSYYQWRDGAVVLEEYAGSSPYPYNGDQLHCSASGYKRIGECICGSIIANFGN